MMFFTTEAKRRTARTKPEGGFNFFKPPVSNITVTDETAFTYGPFYACMRIIAETIAYLPWHVMVSGLKREIASDHPLDKILYQRPNQEMNSFVFRELLMQNLLGWGNAYAEIERNRAGEIVNLWPIDPERVSPDRDAAGKLFYEVSNEREANTTLNPRDMFHLRGPSRDGVLGYSVIGLAKETIGLGLASEAFGAGFFGNGAIPGTVIMNDGTSEIEPEGVRNLLSTFNKKHKGARNAFRTEYLDPGLTIQPIGIPPQDAQFLETRKFQVTEICRWFRIPPHKLADLERSTHTNIEAQNIEFVTDAIMPWVSRIETETNFSLLNDPSQYYNKINVLGVLRGDSKARAEYYKILSNLGVMSINEIRDKEDLDSIGEDGDLRLVPLNMTTPERMRTGDTPKSTMREPVAALVNDQAKRMSKIEITRTKKLAEKGDEQAIASFYVKHVRDLVDCFHNTARLIFQMHNADDSQLNSSLERFFGDYVTENANNLQKAMQSGSLNALFCSWEARKAETLSRDFVVSMTKEAKSYV